MQHVVEKLVLLVPKAFGVGVDFIDRPGDVEKMLEELHSDVDVDTVALGQLEGDAHQVQRVGGDPSRAVGLIKCVTGWQCR
ncbi:hypothetical protein D3C75_1283840 [compost metagenome]